MSIDKASKSDWIVPYNYLPEQFKNRNDIFDEWEKLAQSSEFTLGPKVAEFEKNFAAFVGAKHCIATNNGTDALILALKALGIKNGDEVITVPNSFYATTGAIVACGATPVFIDVDSRYQMDAELLEGAITKKTRAVLPVYWGGAAPDMKTIIEIANKHNLVVVEDACMGIGGTHRGIPQGRFGQIGAFSMHPLKSLNVMGDGGMLVTDDKNLFEWIIRYRNHGMKDRDHITMWGVNMRLQPLQAIVANIELPKVPQIIEDRNRNAEYLDTALMNLAPKIIIPERKSYDTETYSLYMVLCEDRDELLKYLQEKRVDAKIHYPIPLHLQEAADDLGYKEGSFPITESQAKKVITLPVHQFLDEDQLGYMVNCIKDFYL
jgi:dTDP-3-amino-2,3,6-trideoxy-4-keto-D-glucose/dTDP-3-amino-3,4,6-trideoxy-alpha-D-glucose/dTDP-2,6-dideoxy-D-kanosamine transaminase